MASEEEYQELKGLTWSNRHYQREYVAWTLDRMYVLEKDTLMGGGTLGGLFHNYIVSDHTPLSMSFKCIVERRIHEDPYPSSSMYP